MAKIFLDIGAYVGDTASIVVKYDFDVIHCFEPVKSNCSKICKNDRIIVHQFGLLDDNCIKNIYNPGSVGGSIFKEKRNIGDKIEQCKFVKASEWFKNNLNKDDFVLAKINVEGSEIKILNDLIDSGEYEKIKHFMISFDINKVEGMEHEKDEMLLKFHKYNIFNYFISGQIKYVVRKLLDYKVKYSDHTKVIEHWLKMIGEHKLNGQ